MPEKIIVDNCSPTLAGIKTGNLFSISRDEITDLYEELRQLNSILTEKGLRAVPAKVTSKNVLIYLYRPDRLTHDLKNQEAREILAKKGYCCRNTEEYVVSLIEHMKKEETFPHEIGLFLGYPPVDVKGFMENTRKGVKCVGYWKVYGDKEKAQKTFDKYKKCTDIYKKIFADGKPMAQMIVGTNGINTTAS
ncbi:MAG: DUF3793 family protein [Oribacterium sp.]|nr:DUF3793 family protein [Oribacterium sp.]